LLTPIEQNELYTAENEFRW